AGGGFRRWRERAARQRGRAVVLRRAAQVERWGGTGVQGWRGTGIPRWRGTGIEGWRGTGVQGWRGTGIPRWRGTGIEGWRGTGVQGWRGTGIPRWRGTGVERWRGTGVERWRRGRFRLGCADLVVVWRAHRLGRGGCVQLRTHCREGRCLPEVGTQRREPRRSRGAHRTRRGRAVVGQIVMRP